MAPVAILEGKVKLAGKQVEAIVSGGNIDVNKLARIIEHGLVKNGRRIRLRVQVSDQPGSLGRATGAIAEEVPNVLEFYHERSRRAGKWKARKYFSPLKRAGANTPNN